MSYHADASAYASDAGFAEDVSTGATAASAAAYAAGYHQPIPTAQPGAWVKTKICSYFQEGKCVRGEGCSFAHGEADLGQPIPPKGPQAFRAPGMHPPMAAPAMMSAPPKPRLKFKLCTFFMQGKCTKGELCTFAHGDHELAAGSQKSQPVGESNPRKRPMDGTVMCIHYVNGTCQKGDSCTFSHDYEEFKKTRPSGYKSTLCVNYMSTGHCKMDSICSYAHGRYELRPFGFKGDFEQKIKDTPNWKTTLCQFFVNSGSCRNNDDCPYAHGDKELRMLKQTWMDADPVDQTGKKICAYFKQGTCKAGPNCKFSHAMPGGHAMYPPQQGAYAQGYQYPGYPGGYQAAPGPYAAPSAYPPAAAQGYPPAPGGYPPPSSAYPPSAGGYPPAGPYATSAAGGYQGYHQGSSGYQQPAGVAPPAVKSAVNSTLKDVPIPNEGSGVLVNKDKLINEFMGYLDEKIKAASHGSADSDSVIVLQKQPPQSHYRQPAPPSYQPPASYAPPPPPSSNGEPVVYYKAEPTV